MPRTSDPRPKSESGWSGHGDGWTLLSELASAIAVWGGIGFGLDKLFGTWPVLFACGMVIGYAAGAYLIYRRSFARNKNDRFGPGGLTAPTLRARKDEPKP
jgi:ATP synthase protein I